MTDKIVLTPELQQRILASIRAGGFAHVAAQAWGVPEKLWERWLRAGSARGAREPYRSFYRRVQQAQAQARLRAEMEAMAKDARFWLKNGPGLEPAPGWDGTPRTPPGDAEAANAFQSADFLQFLAALRGVLAPYPDAVAAVLDALEGRVPASAAPAEKA